MEDRTRPHIPFSAPFMKGYNNPEITVLTLVTGEGGAPVKYPTYFNILALLRSGRVPLLFVTDERRQTGYLMQLAYYGSSPVEIIRFASTSAQSNDKGEVVTIDFLVGKPPVMRQLPLQRPNT